MKKLFYRLLFILQVFYVLLITVNRILLELIYIWKSSNIYSMLDRLAFDQFFGQNVTAGVLFVCLVSYLLTGKWMIFDVMIEKNYEISTW